MLTKLYLPSATLLLLLCGCSKKEEKEAEPVVPVEVAPVRSDSIRRIVTADAVLFPRDQASVTPKISAPVRKFLVNRGDHVAEGQLLAVLENRDLAAAAAASKGQFEQAEANYRGTADAAVPEQVSRAKSEFEAAKLSLEAAQKLLDSRQKLFQEGALARKQVDEAMVAHAQARSQFESAQEHLRALQNVGKQEQIKGAAAQVEAARGQYQAAQAQVAYSEVRSPIAGVVTDRPLYAGEMANAGSPLLTVMDVSRVVARANVPQNQAALLKVGMPAVITQTGSDVEVPGIVTVVSPAVDPNSTTVQVWAEAANPGEKLRPGASVRVAIAAEKLANALVVPSEAILPGADGGTVVMVIGSDSVAHERKVQAGVRETGTVQILGPVRAGEQVVVNGGVGLQDGAKVTVGKPDQEKPNQEKNEK
jgi:HlyD family secretion protein